METRASETSVYSFTWLDPDKEVYVLQNRKYRKVHKLHISAGYGMTTSGAFVTSSAVQGRLGFFALEDWGAEFVYSKNNGKENETALAVRHNGSSGAGAIPFRRIVDNYMGGLLQWSPFYAKINTFNKVVYMDWILGAGYAKLQETNNRLYVRTPSDPGNHETTEDHNGPMWGTAFKFYLTEYFYVRLDLTGIHYRAQRATADSNVSDQTWYS
ncbi:MAG: outer membrane beta-barrel domain-containing protein, partial [Pseudomonadota bacterium]